MRAIVRHEGSYQTIFASPGVQMILASYCVLLQWDHDDLAAPYWRFYWNESAGAVIRIGSKEIALQPDRVILIPPGTSFGTLTRRPVGHLHMHFSTGLRPAVRRPIVQKPTDGQREMILRLREQLMLGSIDQVRYIADYLAHAVVTSQLACVPRGFWASSNIDVDLQRVLALMYEQPMSVELRDLPEMIAVSPNTFLRRFRRATGTTPARYLIRLRIDNAAIDLRTTADSVDQIAERYGFCDRFHFSKTFKSIIGCSPVVYRANGNQAEPAHQEIDRRLRHRDV